MGRSRWLKFLPLLFLLTSCTQIIAFLGLDKDYFSKYRGVNLLKSWDLDSKNTDGTSRWDITTSTSYMRWEAPTETGVATTYSIPSTTATAPAYRLEIKNLIPDGDFEEEADGDSAFNRNFWSLKQAGVTANNLLFGTALSTLGSVTLSGSPRTINHRSVWWDSNATGNRLQLALDQALGALWVSGTYRLRLDFINLTAGSTFDLYLMADSTNRLSAVTDAQDDGVWTVQDTPSDQTSINNVTKTFTLDSTVPQRVLNLGNWSPNATTSFKAIVDNVRMVQADQEAWVRMEFPSLSSAGSNLDLLPGSKPGTYSFTIQVQDDPTADQAGASGATHSPNRFYPQGLTIRITGKVKSGTGTYVQFFPRPSGGWTTWTELSFDLGFDFVASDTDLGTDPALRIELSPTNVVDLSTGGRDVGSLLVAYPTLQFNP